MTLMMMVMMIIMMITIALRTTEQRVYIHTQHRDTCIHTQTHTFIHVYNGDSRSIVRNRIFQNDVLRTVWEFQYMYNIIKTVYTRMCLYIIDFEHHFHSCLVTHAHSLVFSALELLYFTPKCLSAYLYIGIYIIYILYIYKLREYWPRE